MATTRLTKFSIDKFVFNPDGPTKQVLHDSVVPNLGVRVYASGKKSFALSYRSKRMQRNITLGPVLAFKTVQEVRDEANRLLISLRLEGVDPLEARAIKTSKGITLEALFTKYANEHLLKHAKKSTFRDVVSAIANHLPVRLGRTAAEDISRAMIRHLHEQISLNNGLIAANRTIQMMKAAYTWAEIEEDGSLPVGHRNPCVGVKLNKEKPREKHVTGGELAKLLSAIDTEDSIYVRTYFKLLIHTGCRKSELLTIRRDDVNLDKRILILRNTKNGSDHSVPLNSSAVRLLEKLPAVKENPFVFPGRKEGRPICNIEKAWRRIRVVAGLPDLHIHDIRRSVASLLTNEGQWTLHDVGGLLNHRSEATTAKHYCLIDDPAKRGLVEDLDSILAGYSGQSDGSALDNLH